MKKLNFKNLLKFLVIGAINNVVFAFANYKLPTYSYTWGFMLGCIVSVTAFALPLKQK